MGKNGDPLDWSEFDRRWQRAFGTPFPKPWPGFFSEPMQLTSEQLRALGFYYACRDLTAYRVDTNQ